MDAPGGKAGDRSRMYQPRVGLCKVHLMSSLESCHFQVSDPCDRTRVILETNKKEIHDLSVCQFPGLPNRLDQRWPNEYTENLPLTI